jgi:metallo-beta-lactamase family protein
VREVTGSKHILEVGREKVLLDCGMFQGRRAEAKEKNSRLPFDPRTIRSVILSHAHIDHSAILPVLVRRGFDGPIYATPATCDVAAHMLEDSAKIQVADAKYVNRKHRKWGKPPVKALYGPKMVRKTLDLFRDRPYGQEFDAAPGVRVRFLDAGHILGAALPVIEARENGRTVRIGYAVDLGRKNLPILRDPEPMEGIDYLIIESTYGNRMHEDIRDAGKRLAEIINHTYQRSGKVLIPAFALERTQEVVYILNDLWNEGEIPSLPVYVDSPLATRVTGVFRKHPECFDAEARLRLREDSDLFGYRQLTFIRDVRQSKKLNDSTRPCIIIAASGMCESGRIIHHLRHHIGDPNTTIVMVGFTAQHTLGRRIVERQPEVRIWGEYKTLRAEVVVLDAFSAHADRQDLIEYASHTASTLKGVFIVHGEEKQSLALAEALQGEGIRGVMVPHMGETVELETNS